MNPAAVKTTSHYLRALSRRFWMVLMIAVPLAIASSILILRLPSVYLARGEIEINPPVIDPVLSALMSHETGRHDPSATASYVPNHEAWLRSKGLAQKVVSDPILASTVSQYVDPVTELFKSLTVVRLKGTNSFIVSLEGNDPAQTRKLLEMLLLEFERETKEENENKLDDTGKYADETLNKLKDTKTLDHQIEVALQKSSTIGPGGHNILEERYVHLESIMSQRRLRLGDLQQQLTMAQMLPKYEFDPQETRRRGPDCRAHTIEKSSIHAVSKTCADRSAISTATLPPGRWPRCSTACSTNWMSFNR